MSGADHGTLALGVALASAAGGTCPATGAVPRTVNSLFETTAITVTGAPAANYPRTTDADRLLTQVGISGSTMALGRDSKTKRLTATSVGAVATTASYEAYGAPASVTATLKTWGWIARRGREHDDGAGTGVHLRRPRAHRSGCRERSHDAHHERRLRQRGAPRHGDGRKYEHGAGGVRVHRQRGQQRQPHRVAQ